MTQLEITGQLILDLFKIVVHFLIDRQHLWSDIRLFGLVSDIFGLISDIFGLISDIIGLISCMFGLISCMFGLISDQNHWSDIRQARSFSQLTMCDERFTCLQNLNKGGQGSYIFYFWTLLRRVPMQQLHDTHFFASPKFPEFQLYVPALFPTTCL